MASKAKMRAKIEEILRAEGVFVTLRGAEATLYAPDGTKLAWAESFDVDTRPKA